MTNSNKTQQQHRRRVKRRQSSARFPPYKQQDYRLPAMALTLLLSLPLAASFAATRSLSTEFYVEGTRKPSSASTRLGAAHDKASSIAAWLNPFGVVGTKRNLLDSDNDVDSKQKKVDEYLQFLDKRYHRLHDDEEEGARGEVKFSAWKWLMQGEQQQQQEEESEALARQQQNGHDDALYVLGVAGLASERLLQKKAPAAALGSATNFAFGDSETKTKTTHSYRDDVGTTEVVPSKVPAPIIDASIVTASDKSTMKIPSGIASLLVAGRIAPALRRISVQRKRALRYQTKQACAMVLAVMRFIAKAPMNVGRALWRMGGGQKNVAVTTTVVAALLLFVVRPLAQAIVSDM